MVSLARRQCVCVRLMPMDTRRGHSCYAYVRVFRCMYVCACACTKFLPRIVNGPRVAELLQGYGVSTAVRHAVVHGLWVL